MSSERKEFVALAGLENANIARLCRRFGISRKTGYKWLDRHRGRQPMTDRSRRPHHSPRQCDPIVERAALAVREQHPAWGGRKIRHVLIRQNHPSVPAASTISAILRRAGMIDPAESTKHAPCRRFEHERPNDLWQMDYKGHFALGDGSRCHPLTVLDDHSRFNLGLRACRDQRGQTVRGELTAMFERYGLPRRMLMDNGSPWGNDLQHVHTPFTTWLLRLDIAVTHGRPYHPQTQGKEERFHRTLKLEVLRDTVFTDQGHCQQGFDQWREVYNLQRPHEALSMNPPVSRYQPSLRSMPATLPTIEYSPGDEVRRVQQGGWISYCGRAHRLPKAFAGQPVGLRATDTDGVRDIYFCRQKIGQLNLKH